MGGRGVVVLVTAHWQVWGVRGVEGSPARLLGGWCSQRQQLVQGPRLASASCSARRELFRESLVVDHLWLRAWRSLRTRPTPICWEHNAEDIMHGTCPHTQSRGCWADSVCSLLESC